MCISGEVSRAKLTYLLDYDATEAVADENDGS